MLPCVGVSNERLNQAQQAVRPYGYTIRRTDTPGELAVCRVGSRTDGEGTYYTNDIADAVATALHMGQLDGLTAKAIA